MPYGSWAIRKSGGLCHPVSQGEKILAKNPLGTRRKTKAIHKAEWGKAIKGIQLLRTVFNARLSKKTTRIKKAVKKERMVARVPI